MAERGRPAGRTPKRKTVTFRLIEAVYVEAQEAAYRERNSLTAEINTLLEAWVMKMRKKHNGGEPFTPAGEGG